MHSERKNKKHTIEGDGMKGELVPAVCRVLVEALKKSVFTYE